MRIDFESAIVIIVSWASLEFYLFSILNSIGFLLRRLYFKRMIIVLVTWTSLEFSCIFDLWRSIAFHFWDRDIMELWFVRRLSLKLELLTRAGVTHLYSTCRKHFFSCLNLKRLELCFIGGIWNKRFRFQYLSLNDILNTPNDPIRDIEIAGSLTLTGRNISL